MTIQPQFGEHIRTMRKASGLTQEELARKAGVATNSLRRYEANERTPNMLVLGKLASALGMDLGDFLWKDPQSVFQSTSMVILDWLNAIGYKVEVYEEDAYMWIRDRRTNVTYEICDTDLKDLEKSISAYSRFQVQELLQRASQDSQQQKED